MKGGIRVRRATRGGSSTYWYPKCQRRYFFRVSFSPGFNRVMSLQEFCVEPFERFHLNCANQRRLQTCQLTPIRAVGCTSFGKLCAVSQWWINVLLWGHSQSHIQTQIEYVNIYPTRHSIIEEELSKTSITFSLSDTVWNGETRETVENGYLVGRGFPTRLKPGVNESWQTGSPVRIPVPIHGNHHLKTGMIRHFLKMASLTESEL
jgi:hypothetical protein